MKSCVQAAKRHQYLGKTLREQYFGGLFIHVLVVSNSVFLLIYLFIYFFTVFSIIQNAATVV